MRTWAVVLIWFVLAANVVRVVDDLVAVPAYRGHVSIEPDEGPYHRRGHDRQRPAPGVACQVEHSQPAGHEQDRRLCRHREPRALEHLPQRTP